MWITSNVLVAVGLVWTASLRILESTYPLDWGGPNIGAGFTLLLAYGCIAFGLFGIVRTVRPRRTSTPREDDARTQREFRSFHQLGPATRVLPLAANGILLAAAFFAFSAYPVVSGFNGRVAVAVDGSGAPVLLVHVCRGSADRISVVGPNRGSERNEVFEELRARTPVTAPTAVALLNPGDGWTGAPASLPFSSTPDVLHIASAGGRQSTFGQVTFTGEELRRLDGSTVLVNAGASAPGSDHRSSRADFEAHACDHIDD